MTNRLAIAGLAICAVGGLPATAVAAGLTGTFATTIRGDAASHGVFNGRWTVGFAKSGAFTVTDNGAAVVRGRFAISGSTVRFADQSGPARCPAAGTYRFALAGRTLRFTRIADVCPGRTNVLGHAFSRTG